MPLPIPELQPAQLPMGRRRSGPVLRVPSSGSMRKRGPGYVFPGECCPCTCGGDGCRDKHHSWDSWPLEELCAPDQLLSLLRGLCVQSLFPQSLGANPGKGWVNYNSRDWCSSPSLTHISYNHVSSLPLPCSQELYPSTRSFLHSFLSIHSSSGLSGPSGIMLPKEKVLCKFSLL